MQPRAEKSSEDGAAVVMGMTCRRGGGGRLTEGRSEGSGERLPQERMYGAMLGSDCSALGPAGVATSRRQG